MAIYDTYATALVKDVPNSDLKVLINIFMRDASVNMGNDFTDSTLDRTIEIVEANFRFLPICYIGGAFKKGSLGNYGAGRLVPRTINGWLNEISLEYNRDQDHKRIASQENIEHFKDLVKCPLGKALMKKIDWVKSGAIVGDEWDKIPLKQLADFIGMGENLTPKDFGIKH